MKRLINKPGTAVDETSDGMVATYPELCRLDGANALIRDDVSAEGRVTVVSDGRLGHEPTHVGYLGGGMPDSTAAGEVFTFPAVDQLSKIIQATDASEDVLYVVKNYEGDMMNFDIAAEMAGTGGVDVEQVVVNDDVAAKDSLYTSDCRGVAGTIFVHKCAGMKTATGDDLDEVTAVAEEVVDNAQTMGMALAFCVTPERGESTLDPDEDEIELGTGVYSEPGTGYVDVMSTNEITEHLIENVLDGLGLGEGEEVVTTVNGMGGTPSSELYIVNRKLQSILDDRGVETWDTWVGDYMTSLDMMGCPVSVLRVDNELKEPFGVPAGTPGLTVTK